MPPPRLVCMMQPFSHAWHLSPYVVSSSGQRLVYLEICKVPITLLDTTFRKYVRVQRALCIQIQQALKQHGSAACKPMPCWHCREGRAGEEEKALTLFPSAKLFCAHMSLTGTSLLFSWQSNLVVRDVFPFAPATLAEINTPMFSPAKRFPQRCKVPKRPSAHGEFAEQEKSWARGNEAEKEFEFLVAATAKRERDVKNKR